MRRPLYSVCPHLRRTITSSLILFTECRISIETCYGRVTENGVAGRKAEFVVMAASKGAAGIRSGGIKDKEESGGSDAQGL